MSDYTLYCFAQSGNSYKAALMLNLCGLNWTPRQVDYFAGETRAPAYREINVMGEAPVLEFGPVLAPTHISQSGVILDFLAERTGKFGWQDDDGRREILRWLLFDNHKLTSYTATYRFLVALSKNPDPAVVAFFKARMLGALGVLNQHLASRDWVVGSHPTIADLSLCGYLYFEDEIGIDLGADFERVKRWLGRICALPGWAHPYDLMPGHPLPATG